MSRVARVVIPGIPHHVVQRGVRRMDIFRDDSDRKIYLKLLQESRDPAGCEFHCWCLMPNHVHFIVTPSEQGSLSELFRRAHSLYTRYLNKAEECTGHLWQDRFYSSPLSRSHLSNTFRYILRNPVEAKLVQKSAEFRWSSARFTFTPSVGDPLIKKPVDLLTRKKLQAMGIDGVQQDAKKIEFSLRNNFAYGSQADISKWEKQYDCRLDPERPTHWRHLKRDGGIHA